MRPDSPRRPVLASLWKRHLIELSTHASSQHQERSQESGSEQPPVDERGTPPEDPAGGALRGGGFKRFGFTGAKQYAAFRPCFNGKRLVKARGLTQEKLENASKVYSHVPSWRQRG